MLGLVGESGSGKSVTGFAMTRLLDAAGRITAARSCFAGRTSPDLGSAISAICMAPRWR